MKKTLLIILGISLIIFSYFIAAKYFEFSLWGSFIKIQQYGNKILYEKIDYLKNNRNFKTTSIFILISFLYGIFHAIGPGHGKTIISNYFLKKDTKSNSAIIVSIITSFTHTGTAILLAILFQTILSHIHIFSRIEIIDKISIISGGLILSIGILLLVWRIKKSNSILPINPTKYGSTIGIGILAGIVPCPMSMSIMIISISSGIFYLGIFSVISISIGIFSTLLTVGLLTILFRKSILNYISLESNISQKTISLSMGYLQASIFILIGLFMIRIV